MPRYRTAYPPEFRRQMVDLVRPGRTPEELAREFEPTAQSISTWVEDKRQFPGGLALKRWTPRLDWRREALGAV
jgi:transposase-like protein